jgi:hypothetical protein
MFPSKQTFFALILATAIGASAQGFYKNITVNTSGTGANVTQNVLKYPLLVRLTAAHADVFATARANGSDVRFTKTNGTPLPFQIERWDTAAKIADIWVLVDSVKGANATQSIHMFWSGANVASTSSGAAVFAPANGFAGVWHLSEPITDGFIFTEDATGNFLDGSGSGDLSTRGAGISGFSYDFGGQAGQGLLISDNPSLDVTQLTVSVWVNAVDWRKERRIFDRGNSSYFMYVNTNNGLVFKGAEARGNVTAGAPPINQWALLHGTYDGTSQKFYLNGVLTDEIATSSPMVVTNAPFSIGRHGGFTTDSMVFNGKMDEFRLQSTARNDAWIKLDYETQKPAATTLTFGATTSIRGADGMLPALSRKLAANFSGNGVTFRFDDNLAAAKISVQDIFGRTLWSQPIVSGSSEAFWNGVARSGKPVAPGVYVAQLTVLREGRAVVLAQSRISLTR